MQLRDCIATNDMRKLILPTAAAGTYDHALDALLVADVASMLCRKDQAIALYQTAIDSCILIKVERKRDALLESLHRALNREAGGSSV
jgi:hypothetical protein